MALLIGVCFILALGLLALRLLAAQTPHTAAGIVACPILTDNEREFFQRLSRALPSLHVFPQVAANALLKVDKTVERRRHHSVRNRFAQKHVDFVVCEPDTLRVIAIIELDDRTHRTEKDKARDSMFAQAGYVTHRFESRHKPSEEVIAALFSPIIGTVEEQF